MASSSDVVKKIMRLKLQLSNSAEPATVLKILQKLKELDVTIDILAETGIGKTVNSLKRHKQAGEVAKLLVKGWRKLLPGKFKGFAENKVWPRETVASHENNQKCPDVKGFLSGNESKRSPSYRETHESSDETLPSPKKKKRDGQKEQREHQVKKSEKRSHKDHHDEINNKQTKRNNNFGDNESSFSAQTKKKNKHTDASFGKKKSENVAQKSNSDSGEKFNSDSESEKNGLVEKSKTKLKKAKYSSAEPEHLSAALHKLSSSTKAAKKDKLFGQLESFEVPNRAKERSEENQTSQKLQQHFGKKGHSKHRNKECHKKLESDASQEEPSMSFESCLNYDVNVRKRKEPSGLKKTSKRLKVTAEQRPAEESTMKPEKLSVASAEQNSLMHLMDVPLPVALPELDKPTIEYYYNRKEEREPDFQDEEFAVFTGQRLNKKMQVYSGAKTLFLPSMMSLYQQCIRTLQNNIDMLYETGGVPFELLEPVLERCTPEQLLRIEECNPVYIGVTDGLWGKHCQKDFKGFKLQEYESWKEMYLRLSEERERKLKRLTKTIVSAHSKKPKGRQLKMAFLHTVAKPPRDVRIQQEIHGTAVQHNHSHQSSVKVEENRSKSSSSIGGSYSQEARKKSKVAPIMAKSLKAFKKQLGRR